MDAVLLIQMDDLRLIVVVGQGRLYRSVKIFPEGRKLLSIPGNYLGELLFICGNYFSSLEITFSVWKLLLVLIKIIKRYMEYKSRPVSDHADVSLKRCKSIGIN